MKTLPKTLTDWRGELASDQVRKPLNKLCGDGRARLVYGLTDSAQALPHRAVLLHGRVIAGWVLRVARDFEPEVPGLVSRAMETLVEATPERHSHSGDNLRWLRTVEINQLEDGSNRETVEWNGNFCEDLTYRYGMVEIVEVSKPRSFDNKKA